MYTKPLSYSGMKLFKQCPRRWESRYIHKKYEPQGKAASRGVDLHTEIENFFVDHMVNSLKSAPLTPWRQFMANLTLRNPSVEAKMAVNEHWEPVDFNDPAAYYRGMADLKYEDNTRLHIFDWKSGKIYPDHVDQGRTYMALSPEYEEYHVHFVYLDLPMEVHSFKFTHNDRIQEIRTLKEDIELVRTTTVYEPKPHHQTCQWCPLSWRKGGECRAAP